MYVRKFCQCPDQKRLYFFRRRYRGICSKNKIRGDVTTNKQNGINISPVVGKAIKENLVLGVNAGFGIYNNDYPMGNAEYDTKSYDAGLFLRKYKNISTSGFYIFVQGGLGVAYNNQKQEDMPVTYDDIKRTALGINAYPGISYAVNKKLHLETGFNNLLMVNYFHEKRESGSPVTTYKTNGFSVTSSLNNASSLYLWFSFTDRKIIICIKKNR